MTLWCHKTTICYACIDRPCFYQTVAFLYLFSLSCLFVLASIASFAVYNFFNNFYFHNNVKLHRLSNSFIQYFLFSPFSFLRERITSRVTFYEFQEYWIKYRTTKNTIIFPILWLRMVNVTREIHHEANYRANIFRLR